MKIHSLFLASLVSASFFNTPAFAKSSFEKDLPNKDFSLVESIPAKKNTKFRFQIVDGMYTLFSDLSVTWTRGIIFDLKDKSLTVPAVGFADVKTTADGYAWIFADKGSTFSKSGSMIIKKSASGCLMSWDFTVIVGGAEKIKEKGELAYSCSAGAMGSAPVAAAPVPPAALNRSDLIPKFATADSASLANQLQALLLPHAENLKSCVIGNFNRPATLKDENHYATPPVGSLVYRLSFADKKLIGTPMRAANDERMDSCISDIVRMVNTDRLVNLKGDETKYLRFKVDCKESGIKVVKYECSAKFDVFDAVAKAESKGV